MKVLLVNPPNTSQGGFSNAPLGLLYLAGALEQDGHEVALVDGYLDGWDGIDRALSTGPEMVGITCYTPGRHNAMECARRAKGVGAMTVLGGPHPTIMWKQILENYPEVDLCVLGEGEMTIRELAMWPNPGAVSGLAYRSSLGPVQTPHRPQVKNLDLIDFPAWHLCELDRYPGGSGIVEARNHYIHLGQVRVPIVATRGCRHHCWFCSSWWIWEGHRARSGANVADEVQILVERGYHHFVFEDDAFTQYRASIMDFCMEVVDRDLPIAFFCTTSVDAFDAELARALKYAGCYGVSFGIESGSQRILDRIGKGTTVYQNEMAILQAKAAGLAVCALIIVGNVGETDDTINETVGFLRRCDVQDIGTLGALWVFPGTALHGYAKRQGYVDDNYWLGPQETFTLYDGWTPEHLGRWHHAVCTRTFL